VGLGIAEVFTGTFVLIMLAAGALAAAGTAAVSDQLWTQGLAFAIVSVLALVVVRPALVASAVETMEADAYLLATPANIGYISGALKHYFDTVYYPCLEHTQGRPFAAYVHGNLDSSGAVRAIESITKGLKWRAVAPVLTVTGAPDRAARDAVYELAATLAATVATDPDNSRT